MQNTFAVSGAWVQIGLSLLPGAALAHHGIANFDHNQDVAIAGVVTEIAFVNPHSWIYLDVTAEDGTVTPWRCELRAATMLRRSGWSQEMFAPGTSVEISGSPDRADPNTCYVSTIVLKDGTRLDRYGQITKPERGQDVARPARLASGVPNLSGDWAAEQGVLTDPRGKAGERGPVDRWRLVERQQQRSSVPHGTLRDRQPEALDRCERGCVVSLGLRECLLGEELEIADIALHQLEDDGLLGREVVVEAAGLDPAGVGDLVDRSADARGLEHPRGHIEELGSPILDDALRHRLRSISAP